MPVEKDILNELKEISPAVANLPDSNCMSQPPAGYFSSLPDLIMSKITDAENSQSINPFNSPVTLSTDITSEWNKNPIWEKISKEIPLESPAEPFFKNFNEQVLSRIAEEKEALLLQSELVPATPIIPLYRRNPRRFIIQWAAAAAVVILVGISSLLYFQNDPLQGNPVNVSAELPHIADQEIFAYLGDQPQEVITETASANAETFDDSENLFSDINDEEMKTFLKQDRLSNIPDLN